MAATHILWPPGTSSGACVPACPGSKPHIICTIKRGMADYPCSICGNPIGHDQPFVIDPPVDYLTHIACDEKAAEAAAKDA